MNWCTLQLDELIISKPKWSPESGWKYIEIPNTKFSSHISLTQKQNIQRTNYWKINHIHTTHTASKKSSYGGAPQLGTISSITCHPLLLLRTLLCTLVPKMGLAAPSLELWLNLAEPQVESLIFFSQNQSIHCSISFPKKYQKKKWKKKIKSYIQSYVVS